MAHRSQADHPHEHGPNCGHTAVFHDGHTDYLHDGRMHHPDGDDVADHRVDVNHLNPVECTPDFKDGHDETHRHAPGCGHEQVPHGDHIDYLVDGVLHHVHGEHCDNHGGLDVVSDA